MAPRFPRALSLHPTCLPLPPSFGPPSAASSCLPAARRWGAAALVIACVLASAGAVQPESPGTAPPAPATPETGDAQQEDGGGGQALLDEEALARFERLLERRPFHDAAFNEMVKSFAERGELAKLVTAYEQRVAALPEAMPPRVILARLQLRVGEAEAAAETAATITLPEDSRDGGALLILRSSIAERLGRLEEARGLLGEALAAEATIAGKLDLAEALADLHLRAGAKQEAAAVLTDLSASLQGEYLYRKRIADALAQRALHEAAVAEYDALLEIVGNHAERRCEVLRQMGRSQERLNRPAEAIESYTQAISLLADDHWLQRELQDRVVGLYRASGKLEELVAYCRGQIERSPTHVAMRSLLAEVLSAQGDVDGARAVLAEAVELFPADRSLSERRIAMLDRAGDVEAAFGEHERIIAEHPTDLELYIAYGQALARHERVDAARNQWRRVLNDELADAGTALRLAQIFELHGMREDAAQCYERAITLAPHRPDAYLALSRLKRTGEDDAGALAVLEDMSAANAEDAGMQAELAGALLGFGRTDEALAAIERAVALAPQNVRFHASRADLLVRAGRLEEALRVQRETIELIRNPVEQAQAVSGLVSAYASAGKLTELKDAETAALDDQGEDEVRLLLLARVADAERDFVASRQWLQRLLELSPAHEEAHRQLARLHEAVGDVDAAIGSYRTLIERHPARARQYYQAIVDAMLAYGDKAGAVRTLQRLRQEAGGNVTVLTSVAEQLVRLEELEDGLACYEESLRVQPGRHEVRLAYAKALQEAGRLEDALVELRTASAQTADRDTAAEALGRLHEVAGDLGVVDDLLDELETRVLQRPEETALAATVSRLLIQEYEYARAMELIDAVLRSRPREAELLLVRAELLRRLARFDEALETYRDALPLPGVDRDLVLGEMGRACFEAGRVDEARRAWMQIGHRMYAGSLLRNNGLLDEAVEVLREGIRLKPDDHGLHRNLIEALQAAGRVDEALEAARRLLDLEPGNAANIKQLAKAYLDRGDRAAAAEIAGRLFSADVSTPSTTGQRSGSASRGGNALFTAMQAGGYGAAGPTNLEGAVGFFRQHGLVGELESIIEDQLVRQPANPLLRLTAVGLYSEAFARPERALELLEELESLEFPLEYQAWLGQCSQRDFFRMMRYQMIGTRPALRDARLTALGGRDDLSRDEMLELAMIRQSQGNINDAITLLTEAISTNSDDVLSLSALTDALVKAERFEEAEPHARRLVDLMRGEHERLQAEMVERVRRDFVRTLPVQLQLRVTEDLIRDVAHKWTLGHGMAADLSGTAHTMGYLRARMTLATIHAETGRIEEARAIWQELTPRHEADSEGWTTLASVVQLYDQDDLAFEYYWNAMEASKRSAGDPLLRRIFADSTSRYWYAAQAAPIDSAFNKVVEAFRSRDRLVELYDFLRDSGQTTRAGWIAEQYKLNEKLKQLYATRIAEGRGRFKAADDALAASPAWFAEVCKLAELLDAEGDWPSAKAAYVDYLETFPDELCLLLTLSDVAEVQGELDEAVAWEERAIECKRRLSRTARVWAMREVLVTPRMPTVLDSRMDTWSWSSRWSDATTRGWWGQASERESLELAASWMRVARLRLGQGNTIAAGEAMERALTARGPSQQGVSRQVLNEIRQRRLVAPMLPVLRAMAVQSPDDEQVQLAFGESLEANGRPEVAAEVYRRLLRHGVSNVSVLSQVQQRLSVLAPEEAGAGSDTLASLEASVQADPTNTSERLRLAKAYYYSLRIDEALEELERIRQLAPHLDGVESLQVEILTLRGEDEALIEALQERARRAKSDNERTAARDRLARLLLGAGRIEEALEQLKLGTNPAQPESYHRVGMLLQYYGRHDEAIEQFKLASKSQQHAYGSGRTGSMLANAYVAKGDLEQASAEILAAVQEQLRQTTQYGGVYAMWGGDSDPFQPFTTLFILEPELERHVRTKLLALREGNEADAALTKLLMRFHRLVGESAAADALLQQIVQESAADERSIMVSIDRAVDSGDYDEAVRIARQFISRQPKPEAPPGMPPQYAGMMVLMSPRNAMVCKLGDLYWKQGEQEIAFETYKQIVDEKIDETRLAYATICVLRGRIKEASQIVETTLEAQQVKSPALLQFRAVIAALEDEPQVAFEHLTTIASMGGGDDDMFGIGGGGGGIDQVVRIAEAAGMIDALVEFLRGRIEKAPSDWELRHTLAQVLRDAGRVAEAEKIVEEAAGKPGMRQSAVELQLAWARPVAEPEALVPLYEELIRLAETSNADAASRNRWGGTDPAQQHRQALGDLLWTLGRQDEAIARWTERMDPNNSSSQIGMAQRLIEREAFDKARPYLQRAIELDPKSSAAHRALAGLCHEEGDVLGMLAHLRVVFEQQQARGMDLSDGYRYGGSGGGGEQAWAIALSSDPQVSQHLATLPDAEQTDLRLMLAVWRGDWAAAEQVLQQMRENRPYDPSIWTLLIRCYEQRGAWEEAAAALQQARRLAETSLPDHRRQLELVLAGKQIREAAAGTRQGGGPAAAAGGAGYVGYYGGSYYDPYGSADSTTQRLAAIHTRLGDFQKAEQLYLSGRMQADAIAPLAHIMWGQGARERALELLRLSATMFSNNPSGLVQYADMLAEAGEIDQAISLLSRAYAYSEPAVDEQSGWYARYYWDSSESGVDSGRQATFGQSLHAMLKRYGRLEGHLSALADHVGNDPGDLPSRRLLLSLYMRDGRWRDVQASLEDWLARQPGDPSSLKLAFQAALQLGDWEAARQTLEFLRAAEPEQTIDWLMHEAVLGLAAGEPEHAAAALAGASITGQPMESEDVLRLCIGLACSGRQEEVIQTLTGLGRERTETESSLLLAALEAEGQWERAAGLSLEQFWRQDDVTATGGWWFDAFRRAVRGADAAAVELRELGPAGQVLRSLCLEGTEAAAALSTSLLLDHPDDVDLRRAAIFAAWRTGDWQSAHQGNEMLLDWLEPRRMHVWIRPTPVPLSRRAQRYLEQTRAAGLDTQAVLQMSMQYESMLEQVISAGEEVEPRRYGALYDAHLRLRLRLLRHMGDADGYEVNARVAAAKETTAGGYDPYAYWRSSDLQNWPEMLRELLLERGRFAEFLAHCEGMSVRLPEEALNDVAAAHAALGDAAEAQTWRRHIAELRLAQLTSTARPSFGTRSPSYWWWHRSDDTERQVLSRLRSVRLLRADEQNAEVSGLSDLARADTEIESHLLSAAQRIGPGWESTQLLDEVVDLYQATDRNGELIDLLEKVCGTDNMVQSPHLAAYLGACAATGDQARFGRTLASIERFSPRLKSEADLLRLAMWRLGGQSDEADELEAACLHRCVRNRPNPSSISAELQRVLSSMLRSGDVGPEDAAARWTNRSRGSALTSAAAGMRTVSELAAALGVNYTAEVGGDDLTLDRLVDLYDRFDLPLDAVRILDLKLTEQTLPAPERDASLRTRAMLLHRLERAGEARETLEPVLRRLTSQLESDGSDPAIVVELVKTLGDPKLADDADRALATLRAAKEQDPLLDLDGRLEADLLFKVGRNEEAWTLYQKCFEAGAIRYTDATSVLQAGIAGASGGDEAAQTFLRFGLWRSPSHELAARARELVR